MFLGRMFAQEFLEPLRDDMATVGDYELWRQFLAFLLGRGIQDRVEVLDG